MRCAICNSDMNSFTIDPRDGWISGCSECMEAIQNNLDSLTKRDKKDLLDFDDLLLDEDMLEFDLPVTIPYGRFYE